jgi:hypothetical protein
MVSSVPHTLSAIWRNFPKREIFVKSRFSYAFTSKSISFDGTQRLRVKIKGSLTPRTNTADVPAKQIDMDVRIEIVPSKEGDEDRFPDGELYITLPGDPDDSVFMARTLSHGLAEHLSFFYEDFKIAGGMESAERIPEDDEEAKIIGEDKYWARVQIEEVPPPIPFDRRILSLFPYSREFQRIIEQYNSAKKSKNPIDHFLGMFKVMESQFHIGKKKARDALLNNKDFCQFVLKNIRRKRETGGRTAIRDHELRNFVNILINIRDRCAHLKEQNDFGYAPYDAEVFEEVKPHSNLIEYLATELLMEKYRMSNQKLFDSIFDKKSRVKKEPEQQS